MNESKIEYLKSPIIVDIGGGEVKAGFSGEEKPKVIFKNYIGEKKYKNIFRSFKNENISSLNEIFIGEDCDKHNGVLKLSYPVKHGIFSNEQDILSLFNHIYTKLGCAQEIKEHPILITEPLLNPYSNREKIASALFGNLGIPALFFASQPILSMFSTSKTSGTILESGEGVSQSCVVFEGYSLPLSYERYDYGGGDVTKYLNNLLTRKGYSFYNSADLRILNEIKENFCYCSLNKESKNKNFSVEYVLPDGNSVILDEEKELATEILFDPLLMGKEYLSLHEMIKSSVEKIDMELKSKGYNYILLAGGNTKIKGLKERLNNELKKIISPNLKININSSADPQNSCWIGGNVISTLEIFRKMWVTKKDWVETGAKIVHVKTI